MILRHRLAALFEAESVLIVRTEKSRESLQLPESTWQKTVLYQAESTQWPASLELKKRLDLAVVSVPAAELNPVLEKLSLYQPRALLLLTHYSSRAYDASQQHALQQWAQDHHCLLLGPRSFGLMRPNSGLNLSIQPQLPNQGKVALVSQSRTITTAILDWAQDANIGFSTVVDMGDEADVDLASVLDFLAVDNQSDSVILYLHSHPTSRRFASALYAATATKPIIVLKAAALDHSKELRAREEVFSALIRRTGAIRVRYLLQLYAAVKILSLRRRLKGTRIAMVANGDGITQLALDIMRHGSTVRRASLSMETIEQLADGAMENDQLYNPVVRYAPWTTDFIDRVLPALAADPQVDGILVLLAPDPYADLHAIAEGLIALSKKLYKPLVTCWVGEYSMRGLRSKLEQAGIAALRTPDAAMDALNTLASYHYSQQLAQQIIPAYPLGRPANIEAAKHIVLELQQQGVRQLNETDCAQLLACFHVPILAQAKPYTVPTLAPTCIHMYTDAQYGPFMVFGAAAGNLEFISSRTAVELPPLNRNLARHLIERAPIWYERLHDVAGEDVFRQLQQALEKLSELISEIPEIKTIQIDPLWLSPSGLYCSKIRMELHPLQAPQNLDCTSYQHMAIHPYPRHLVQHHQFKSGQPWVLRPIRPEDAQALQDFVRDLSAESRYMRFVSMMRELSPSMLARYSRIDYSRELALVATVPSTDPMMVDQADDRVIAFVHYLRNNDGRGAEYALVVADDWQRHGLGSQLMRAIIEAAKSQGLSYIDGYVLATNDGMLALLKRLGFKNDIDKYDPGLRRVWLDLGGSETE